MKNDIAPGVTTTSVLSTLHSGFFHITRQIMQEATISENSTAVGEKRASRRNEECRTGLHRGSTVSLLMFKRERMLMGPIGERMRARPGVVDGLRFSVEPAQDDMTLKQSQAILPPSHHVPDMSTTMDLGDDRQIENHLMFSELINSSFEVDASSNETPHFLKEKSTTSGLSFGLESRFSDPIYDGSSVLDLDMEFDSYLDQLSTINLDFGKVGSMLEMTSSKPYQGYIEPVDHSSKLAPSIRVKEPSKYSTFPCSVANGINGNTLASGIIHHLRLDDTNENKSLVKTTLARGHNIRDVFLAGLAVLGKEDRPFQVPLPKPRKTTITLLRVPTLQAYMAIAVAIGLELPEEKPHDWQTTFYQPQALAAGEFNAIVALHQKLPLCMRPTPAQILYPHIAWVDVIPFPALRERIVIAMAVQGPLLAEEELKDDLFMRNGLFCWRSSEKGGSGQPWDMRSWEAEPWFLEKWSGLLGGENGEVWRQTQWWRSLRGMPNVKGKGAV